jgi:hypothetical protein
MAKKKGVMQSRQNMKHVHPQELAEELRAVLQGVRPELFGTQSSNVWSALDCQAEGRSPSSNSLVVLVSFPKVSALYLSTPQMISVETPQVRKTRLGPKYHRQGKT